MKVSKHWLKELVELKVTIEEVIKLLPLRTIGVKEETPQFFELDMKGYNRADLLSLRGVAYEVAAITDSKIRFSEQSENEYIWLSNNFPQTKIEVKNPDLCPTYCIAKIEGLKIEPSSPDWVKKLADSGMRSVNNVADVTNLIMLEYGQPLHSFDAGVVKDETLIVRTTREGEEIVTLDGKKRKLHPSDLLITDPEKAVGIAGVMGGQNSEITDSTNTILLEAAIFDPVNLRQTATRLNLQSEASRRFQHGLTKKRCLQAFDAAIRMYESLGGKVTAITLSGNLVDQERKITLTKKRLDTIIGIEIKPEAVETYLNRLHFGVEKIQDGWEVTVPYFRLDIEIEDDVIEEVARMYGYEKLPAKELPGETPKKIDQSFYELVYQLKNTLVNLGLTEIHTYSFYSTQVLKNVNFDRRKLIKILNPMSAETEYMRNNLWPNLLEVTAKNIRNGIKDVAIFETGKVYQETPEGPKESYHLAIAISNGTDNPIAELSVILNAVKDLSIYLSPTSVGDSSVISLPQNDNGNLFHPNRFAVLEKDGKKIGKIGEIHPKFVNKFGIDQRIAILEIEFTKLQ